MSVSGSGSYYGMSHRMAFDGFFANIVTAGGPGPASVVIIAGADGLSPNDPNISLQFFAGSMFISSNGTDANGSISIIKTYVNQGDDIHFNMVGGGTAEFTEGFWNGLFRIVTNTEQGTREIHIQYSAHDILNDSEWPPNPTFSIPTNVVATPAEYNEETEGWEVTYSWDAVPDPDEIGTTVVIVPRTGPSAGIPETKGSVPAGITTYTDTIYPYYGPEFDEYVDEYDIHIIRYRNPGGEEERSITCLLEPELFPDPELCPETEIILTGSPEEPELPDATGGNPNPDGSTPITFSAFQTESVLIADPSGIYTMVVDKRHDTMYERMGEVETLELAIPDPYIKTGFIG